MQIVLDETGIAVLVGLVGLCTYLGASVLTHLKTSQLRKREETAESESPTSTARARRLSLGKKGFRRTESLKSEHVVFADEISGKGKRSILGKTNLRLRLEVLPKFLYMRLDFMCITSPSKSTRAAWNSLAQVNYVQQTMNKYSSNYILSQNIVMSL